MYLGFTGELLSKTNDNAPNIVKAMEMVQGEVIRCNAHSLNLAVQDAFAAAQARGVELVNLQERCRNISTFFQKSNVVDDLRRECDKAGIDCSVKTDVSNRWNSCYDMMVRLLELQGPITIVFQQSDDPEVRATNKRQLTPEEWENVRRVVQLLKSIYEATNILQANSYPTLSLVHLVWSSIILDLNEQIEEKNQPAMVIEAAQVFTTHKHINSNNVHELCHR